MNPLLYALIKYSGVVYLFYIGLKGLLSKPSAVVLGEKREQISDRGAFLQGFWTNLLNPKCALFFISLFSQFIDPSAPFLVGIEYGLITWSIVTGWFWLLSYLLTHQKLLGKIDRFRHYFDKIMGAVLMGLGFKILLV